MKRYLTAMLAMACAAAFAIEKPGQTPQPNGTTTTTITGTLEGHQQQEAIGIGGGGVGYGTGIVDADLQAGGGRGSASAHAGPSQSYAATAADIDFHSKDRSLSIGFGAPVWTQVPAARSQCAMTNADTTRILLGVFERANSKQATEAVCALIYLRDGLTDRCQYRKAAMVDQRLYPMLVKGTTAADWEFLAEGTQDLSPVACAERIRPRLLVDGRQLQLK